MTRTGRSRWQSIVTLATLAVGCATALTASAQSYRALKPIPLAQAKAISGKVATILRNTTDPSADDTKTLNEFFMKYIFPSMTVYDPPEALGQIAITRDQLFTRYINTAKSQGARDYLTSNTLKAMDAIAKGYYHPASRYNAVLIIGQLNDAAGKPLPAATEPLLAILENTEFKTGNATVEVPTALKLAAMIGLQRRVDGMDPALAARVTKAATAIALLKEAPEDAPPEAYGWVRKQAAKLLAAQVAKSMTPPVQETFVALLADKSIHLDDRCGIAQLLKPEMYTAAQGLDVEAMTNALGELSKQVLSLEADDAKKFEDEFYKNGGGGFGTGGGGMGFGRGGGEMGMGNFGMMPEDLGPKYERRRMIDRLLAVADGASAVAAGGTDESKAKLTELAASLRGVAEGSAPDNVSEVQIAPEVRKLAVSVNKMVTTWAPAAAAGDDAAMEDEFGAEAAADEPADEAADPAGDAEAAPAGADAVEPAADKPAAEAPAAEVPESAG
ncbi:hypothetical protein [Lacipirellula parvula]|uniref:Uncharacterized protein n=1 Tax=Lacipirellula parvula TaxID=2650471 RepID=A0A5K7XRI1_9BACT|nr:hypothetical protein [Lacipirellula parvula]BBO36559.1 hypothetical protein PLANPX_6171 [Lacipirellula parvula]